MATGSQSCRKENCPLFPGCEGTGSSLSPGSRTRVYSPILTWTVLAVHHCLWLVPAQPIGWSLKNSPHITTTLPRSWAERQSLPAQHSAVTATSQDLTSETRDPCYGGCFLKTTISCISTKPLHASMTSSNSSERIKLSA